MELYHTFILILWLDHSHRPQQLTLYDHNLSIIYGLAWKDELKVDHHLLWLGMLEHAKDDIIILWGHSVVVHQNGPTHAPCIAL